MKTVLISIVLNCVYQESSRRQLMSVHKLDIEKNIFLRFKRASFDFQSSCYSFEKAPMYSSFKNETVALTGMPSSGWN